MPDTITIRVTCDPVTLWERTFPVPDGRTDDFLQTLATLARLRLTTETAS